MKGLSSATLWIVLFLVFILLFIQFSNKDRPEHLTILQWKDKAEQGLIIDARDEGGLIMGTYQNPDAPIDTEVDADSPSEVGKPILYEANYLPEQSLKILEWVEEYNLDEYDGKVKNTMVSQLLFTILIPLIVIVALWLLLMRQIQGGGNKAMSFGKSRAKLVKEGEIKITFNDVAGVEEAKEELEEIVDFLRDPKKYSCLGGRIPKGVLLIGPPGTGKTLLAKAIAGEASVPFFSISGSDFVEMFVGVGASRVRDLFEQAKKSKPCIIFIDEIDAVGRSRFAGIGGGHDEREQTLNQLLVEMDGFAENEGVILISATNRPDVLDPALLRPGRFDRQITVDLPDLIGREKILKVHSRNIKIDVKVDITSIAKGTPGFSGADLANLINEAALLAARRGKDIVGQTEFEEAKDRVMMGPERRSMALSDKEKLNTAYHEAGHAIVAHFTPESDPVHKITIVPRGRALGATWILPGEDRHTYNRSHLISQLYHLLGGRAAEEVQFSEYTTGASNDLERATALAHRMVCDFGMSEKLGPRTYGKGNSQVFLGRDLGQTHDYSEETASIIDEEVKRLIDEAHEYALKTLRERRDVLNRIAEALVERETLDEHEFVKLVKGETLPPLKSLPVEGDTPDDDKAEDAKPDEGEEKPPQSESEVQPAT